MKEVFAVEGMTCAACAQTVEKQLLKSPSVQSASVNLASEEVLIEFEEVDSSEFKRLLQEVGYDLHAPSAASDSLRKEDQLKAHRVRLVGAMVCTLPIMVLSMGFPKFQLGHWMSFALSLPVIFWFGRSFYTRAWQQITHGFTSMDTLVAISTGSAFLFSCLNFFYPEFLEARGYEAHLYFEAATAVIAFILIGKYLEEKAKIQTGNSLKELFELQSKYALKKEGNEWLEVEVINLHKDDLIRIAPGELIPADGLIASGESSVDESSLTGESIPANKSVGSEVYSGSLNINGSIEVRVSASTKESQLARIIEAVKKAQGSKANIQKLADRVSSIFVPTVLVIALLTFLGWFFFAPENNLEMALITSLSVLVIACPCALGLATPTAVVMAIGKAAERGIFIKEANSLELATNIQDVIFDKTGTLSEGKVQIKNLLWINEDFKEAVQSLTSHSKHPFSVAIAKSGKHNKAVEQFNEQMGLGVSGLVEGERLFVGNESFVKNICDLSIIPEDFDSAGSSLVYAAKMGQVVAVFALDDPLRKNITSMILELKSKGIRAHILSGDRKEKVTEVAQSLGIVDFKYGCSPQEKLQYIQALQKDGRKIGMIGDGINDSPALAQADLSFAIRSGSATAIESADISVPGSAVVQLSSVLDLAEKSSRIIKQNLFWAFVYNLLGIPLAAGVLYFLSGSMLNPMYAGAAMALSSVSVVLNSLRIRSFQWPKN